MLKTHIPQTECKHSTDLTAAATCRECGYTNVAETSLREHSPEAGLPWGLSAGFGASGTQWELMMSRSGCTTK